MFYYFNSAKERDIFVRNPGSFTDKIIFCTDRNTPLRIRNYKAAEIVNQEKALLGHCPVTLKDEGKVEKGIGLLVCKYKDNTSSSRTKTKWTVSLPVQVRTPTPNCQLRCPLHRTQSTWSSSSSRKRALLS